MASLLMDTLKTKLLKFKVAVVGAGIIGLSTAVRILETFPNVHVTLISEHFTPDTTGDGSAGFWKPYLCGDVPYEEMRQWCQDTFNFLLNLYLSPESSAYGVGLLSAYSISQTPMETPVYADQFLSYRNVTEKDLKIFPSQYKYGVFYTTLYAECTKLLPYLMKRFKERGGVIIKRRIDSLSELAGEYGTVINCTGIEAAYLVSDPDLKPIRGQVLRVKAPWIKHAIVADDHYYILPNTDVVILGGTKQVNDWNRNVDPKDRDEILEGCCSVVPSLKKAEVVKEWVGLRPGRSKPRIEHETLVVNGKKLEVIHNYGHGGSGVTLFWGCAKKVTNILQELRSIVLQQSKL